MEKKISKKTLNKSFRNWYYGHLTCFSQEHMQTFGYLCAMLPIIEELYKTKEEQKKAMQTYTAFFNTEPQVGSVVVGITASLEEAKANGADDINAETINGIQTAGVSQHDFFDVFLFHDKRAPFNKNTLLFSDAYFPFASSVFRLRLMLLLYAARVFRQC